MSIIKYFFYLLLSFIVAFAITFFIYYEDIKSDEVEKFQKQSDSISIYLNELLKNTTLNNDFNKINSSINTLLNIDNFDNIELTYKRFIFSKKAILINSNKITNENFKLSDITTDYKYGKIVAINEDTYELIPSIFYNINDPLIIKFQSYSNGDVYNSNSNLNFYKFLKNDQKKVTENNDSWLKDLIKFNDISVEKAFTIKYMDSPYVDVKYVLTTDSLYDETVVFIKKIFIYSISLFLITLTLLYIFYVQIVKKDIEKPIEKVSDYIQDILNNRYVRLSKTKQTTKFAHIDTIFGKLQLMSKKVSSLTNELNINKELLGRKELIDEITGLANKKVFEKDMKSMFITNQNAYVILTRISNLGEFSSKHGSNEVNNLVKDFGYKLTELVSRFSKKNHKVYRFFGAEFAVIINITEFEELQKVLKEISYSLYHYLKDQYLLNEDIVYFGATPFDNYGTIDTILHSAHDTYLECSNKKTELYSISNNAKIVEKTQKMEILVKDIIERKDFTLKYIYDTLELDDDENLLMQDASPIILNSETFEMFPIGIFISVAEKLNLSAEFDQLVIEKVLDYLEYEKLKHKIVISLSMRSLTDKGFLSWIEGILLYNETAKDKLVFSVSASHAKEHIEEFKSLQDIIHKFEAEILLKRFTLDDFTLAELDGLNIDYIRLDRDYCSHISEDRAKKHIVKSIILYAEMHDINILGDFVKSDADYKVLKRIGLYATSR